MLIIAQFYKMYCDDVLGSGQFGTVFGGMAHTLSQIDLIAYDFLICTIYFLHQLFYFLL